MGRDSGATRRKLVEVARKLFSRDGYAATGTEAILEGAGVRRGALYHHFADKAALFEAVCEQLAEEGRAVIEEASADAPDAFSSLERGARAWLAFMRRPDVRRVLVLDGPSVLGYLRWETLDEERAFRLLREGVREALEQGALRFDGSPDTLALMLGGAMNALALREPSKSGDEAIVQLLAALRAGEPRPARATTAKRRRR